MSIIELKAAAYDILANLEHLQKQLSEINQKIAEQLQKKDESEAEWYSGFHNLMEPGFQQMIKNGHNSV